ncbi:MAG: hypothetical protein ACRC8G_09010 [Plesiomonas shigelloides]
MKELLIKLADMLNGNAKRRRAIKQRLVVAMMQTDQHQVIAARHAAIARNGQPKGNSILHWRSEFHRNAI